MATVGRHVGCSFHRVEGDRLPEGRRIKSVRPQRAVCAEPIRSGHYCQRVKFEHQLKAMPITADDEELSEEDLEDIALALKEKNEGSWETLKAEIPAKQRK